MGKTYDQYMADGKKALEDMRFDSAIALYSRAICLCMAEKNGGSHDKICKAYISRSEAYCAKEQWDQAIEDCSFVLAENENDADALATQAFAYYKKSDMGSAKKNCEELITITTDNIHLPLAYDLLMTIMAYKGDKASYEEVKKRYYEAIGKDKARAKGKGLDSLTIREKYLEACQALKEGV
ncbi:MAG: tetratricopeptide repeat protein [Treponematales bacterium]